jgi:hypothetical protein
LPVRQAHPFDGFDRLPFDGFDKLTAGTLRVCDTAGRLRMTLSGSRMSQGPERVEGLAGGPFPMDKSPAAKPVGFF